jgi:hypothetical protein
MILAYMQILLKRFEGLRLSKLLLQDFVHEKIAEGEGVRLYTDRLHNNPVAASPDNTGAVPWQMGGW